MKANWKALKADPWWKPTSTAKGSIVPAEYRSVQFRSGVAGGSRGSCPPKLLVNVFSPINLRCYVLLVCK